MAGQSSQPQINVTLALVVQKLDDLLTRFEALKAQFDAFVEGRQALDKRLSIVESALIAIERKVCEHEAEIDKLTDIIRDLGFTNRVLKWLLGVSTGILVTMLLGVIGFGISLLTGQTEIIHP
jgi:chromosome segregation ATPase